jgi:hypothetical protein
VDRLDPRGVCVRSEFRSLTSTGSDPAGPRFPELQQRPPIPTARRKLASVGLTKGGHLYARVATFESDPAKVDDAINLVRTEVESGNTPSGLEGTKMLMLINRESGKGLGVTLFESQEAMRRGDEALDAMSPGASERRTSVEFYEVPVQTVS